MSQDRAAPQAHPLSRPDRRYRCYLQRSTEPADTGVRPFLQLKAASAEAAARAALAVSGAIAVVEVERLEECVA